MSEEEFTESENQNNKNELKCDKFTQLKINDKSSYENSKEEASGITVHCT